MIILQDFFDTLATGEFSNISLSNSILSTITADKYPTIINNMNLGLIELYKRFTLKEKTIVLYEHADVTQYLLRSDYLSATVALVDENAYLFDSNFDPFDDDIIKITDATYLDSDGEVDRVYINNKLYPDIGIFTTAFDTIKLTPQEPLRVITLTYLASYPKIVLTNAFDPSTYELFFPEWIQEPLLAYIAARIFQGKASKAAEGERNLYTTFMYQYENSCKKIELLGLAAMSDDASENFTNNGWV